MHAAAPSFPGTAPASLGHARVDHIGIAVADLDAASALYRTLLGCEPRTHVLPEQGIAVAMFDLPQLRIELLAPTGAESPIADVLEGHTIQAFMARQPLGGLHHVCYVVPDLEAAQPPGTRRLGSGVPIIGAQGRPIVFLDPMTTGGTLIELKQAG
jgi:methylmalonyl-CoA/ethylmalonyl-CoA epimerase